MEKSKGDECQNAGQFETDDSVLQARPDLDAEAVHQPRDQNGDAPDRAGR